MLRPSAFLTPHTAGHTLTTALVIGGNKKRLESEALRRGSALVVATPGRLLDHLNTTEGFQVKNVLMLILDEADRLLESGFKKEQIDPILRALPQDRQTALFSATMTEQVEWLAQASFTRGGRGEPIKVGVIEATVTGDGRGQGTTTSTAQGLQQGYILCPSETRFLMLFTFLKRNTRRKVIVFMSSINSVKFHAEMLNYIDLPVLDLHGKHKQSQRTSTFKKFCAAKTGILVCTDVAARGLDIPDVDWIIQYCTLRSSVQRTVAH